MGNQQERRDAAIYLAAMIQGEGSVMLYRQRGGRNMKSLCVSARVVIYNTDTSVLDEIQRYYQVLDAGEYRHTSKRRDHGWQRLDLGTIFISGYRRLARFLPHVIPFLVGEKRRKADALFRLADARKDAPIRSPYEPWQDEIINTLCARRVLANRKARLESSTTNTSGVADSAMKIESDPLARALGGETVTEYPTLVTAE